MEFDVAKSKEFSSMFDLVFKPPSCHEMSPIFGVSEKYITCFTST